MTTPNNPVPDETVPTGSAGDDDISADSAGDEPIPGADAGAPGAEVGMTDGDSYFEPEEDPEGHTG